MSLGGRPCEQGKKREIVPAVPLTHEARMKNYARQAGRLTEDGGISIAWLPTLRQYRRLNKKDRHHTARAGSAA
jgi:hypothetical protein